MKSVVIVNPVPLNVSACGVFGSNIPPLSMTILSLGRPASKTAE